MKSMHLFRPLLLIVLLTLSAAPGKAALFDAFIYQGFLSVNGSPADGNYQMLFGLYRQGQSAPVRSLSIDSVPVSRGVFTVPLDFGQEVFEDAAYELGIAVRQGGGAFTPLTPRQPLTPTPFALRARTASSVPDSALSANVALLNTGPVFTMGMSAPMLRVADADGGGVLSFGNNPDNLCAIAVDPQGPAGLLLRDPRGVRILSPDPASPPRLFFGPTDDCSLGIDPAFPGLVERDPVGFRLLGRNNQGCRLIFGPTMDCTVEVEPEGPTGLLLRDPRGIRIIPRDPADLPLLRFGPTDDCSLGIDPAFPGLIERDPIGFRLLGRNNQGCRLIFGPTMDCTVEIDPAGPPGLLLRDPKGIRLLPRDPAVPPRLLFGPTDDCSLGIDPAFPGLVERDPIGFRLLGRDNQGCRLIFGPTMDCTVEVNPSGPPGLLLRDPRGIRILSPNAQQPPALRFGPTDDCSLGIDPVLSGLLLRDPRGIRIAPADPAAPPTLFFGPTDLCSLGIDPTGELPGLIERDPVGFRLLGRDLQGCRLIFGPTMDCTVEIDPQGPSGLLLRDPRGIRLLSPDPLLPPTLRFGPTDDCSLGIDPAFPGLVERDPIGFRLLGRNNEGCRLIFGPTMDCTIEVQPPGVAGSIPGLLLRDPRGIRVLSPDPRQPPTLRFGPTDDCSLGIDPVLTGLLLRDPKGIRIAPADPAARPTLRFGPTDDCSLGIDPAFPGLVERDPIGLRLLGPDNQGGRLIFGPTMACTIEVQPSSSNSIAGLLLRDPRGIRILSPAPTGPNTLLFGPTDDCRISAPGPNGGMGFSDPRGFNFGSQVTVNGPVFAQAFVQTSSRRFKNDVKPIEQPLETIAKLQGVRFTWNEEKGGGKDVGFIAEEVAKVVPEVVSWEEDGQNARGVNYDHLVAVAIEGIKAQQAKIESLEREKTKLTENLANVQTQLDRLSRQLETLAAR